MFQYGQVWGVHCWLPRVLNRVQRTLKQQLLGVACVPHSIPKLPQLVGCWLRGFSLGSSVLGVEFRVPRSFKVQVSGLQPSKAVNPEPIVLLGSGGLTLNPNPSSKKPSSKNASIRRRCSQWWPCSTTWETSARYLVYDGSTR